MALPADPNLGKVPPVPNLVGEMFSLTYECVKCHLPVKEYDAIIFRGKPYGISCGCANDVRQLAGKGK